MRGGGYQHPQTTTTSTATYNIYYDNNRPTNSYPIPQPSFVEHRSTNPHGYSQHHSGFKKTNISQSTQSRRINPALTINPNQLPPRSHYPTHGKQNNFARKDTRAEIDDSPIIDPSAFQFLNLNERRAKKKTGPNEMESGIDSRPIINLDAVAQLERRRQQQLEKNNRLRGDDGSKGGIDDSPIVDLNAFRYIEGRTNKNDRQGQNIQSGIDDRPITNPDAFKYIDGRRQKKLINQFNEPSIDSRPIINPDAFRYIEKRDIPTKKTIESGIDSKPIVNPNAFRYLETNNSSSPHRDIYSGVDSTSIINPNAFQYIERRTPSKREAAESSIDYRPIVNPQAFKWIERKETKRRV
ncbi:unnamed protein product, partial [Adineta steineri]